MSKQQENDGSLKKQGENHLLIIEECSEAVALLQDRVDRLAKQMMENESTELYIRTARTRELCYLVEREIDGIRYQVGMGLFKRRAKFRDIFPVGEGMIED